MAHCQFFVVALYVLHLQLSSVDLHRTANSSIRFDRLRGNLKNGRNIPGFLRRPTHNSKRFIISESREPDIDGTYVQENTNEEKGYRQPSRSRQYWNKKYNQDFQKFNGKSLGPEQDRVSTTSHQSFRETSQTLIKRLCHMRGKVSVCYEHGLSKCHCKGQLADCSGKRFVPNISYAPKLPKGIKCLIFQNNYVQNLDDSFFANVSDYQVIDFSSNKLRTISKKTFGRFSGGLQYLILNYNSLSYKNVRNVLNYPPSIRLDLIAAGISKSIPKDFFKPYADIPTSELYLDLNFFSKFDLNEFSVLKKLRYLSAKNCSIHQLTSAFMPTVEFVYFDNNPIAVFPASCTNTVSVPQYLSSQVRNITLTSLFPKLKEITLNNARINKFPLHTELCLPKLEILELKLNNISAIHSYSLQSLTSLRVLILDRMKSNISTVESHAFSSQSLTTLHLSKNHMKCVSQNISEEMFGDCPSLDVLHLDHNNFSNVQENSYINLFKGLHKLKFLYMGSCQMTYIPSKAFSLLSNLNRLYLYLNEIASIPTAAFDDMQSLQYLYLDQNRISTVSHRDFSPKTIHRLKTINLSKNDFQCNCNLLWFQSWLMEAGSRQFMDNSTGYVCANRPGTMVTKFVLSKQACMFSQRTYILFTVCLALAIAIFVLFSIFYHYRWDIRLSLYKWRSVTHDNRPDHLPEPTHDVFIVYCNDDSTWVVDNLLHRIEIVWGLRAFVHERDFEAGRPIMDNIVMAMNTCRHILVVVSSRFTHSQWCKMELQLCQSHIIEHDLPSLLVVELERMEPREMSRIVAALYRSTTFLEWPENPRDENLFWQKLERRIRQIKSACKRSRRI